MFDKFTDFAVKAPKKATAAPANYISPALRDFAKNNSHEKISIHQRILGIQTLTVRTKAMEYQGFHIKIAILGCSPPDLMAS